MGLTSLLERKLATARRVYRQEGPRGIASELRGKVLSMVAMAADPWRGENWWLGKTVELRGDKVRLDGLVFDVGHPAIPTRTKAWFLWDRYERPERNAVRLLLDPALPVVELGGSIGVVACVTNHLLRIPARHVVVEANPALLPLLRANRDRNGADFRILGRALAYGRDAVEFGYQTSLGGSVGGSGETARVPTITLAEILEDSGWDRCTLIVDIEGAEVDLVRHEVDVLRRCVATLIMETHPHFVGTEPNAEILRMLAEAGFQSVYSSEHTVGLRNPRVGDAA